MTVRRQQVITLNVPINILAQNISDVLRGNPFYKNVTVREDQQEFTFTSPITLWAFPLQWYVLLSSKGSQTLVIVENKSQPFVYGDVTNIQNRYITDFLTTLRHVADQTLLRAASAPTALAETLLRPADTGCETAAEELLRPDPYGAG